MYAFKKHDALHSELSQRNLPTRLAHCIVGAYIGRSEPRKQSDFRSPRGIIGWSPSYQGNLQNMVSGPDSFAEYFLRLLSPIRHFQLHLEVHSLGCLPNVYATSMVYTFQVSDSMLSAHS